LLTYLLEGDLEPAPIRREGAPPPRSRAEVQAVLKATPSPNEPSRRPLKILLMSGEKDHGIDEHDYPAWQDRWARLLPRPGRVSVHTANGWPPPEEFDWADVIVWFSANPGWTAEKGGEFDKFFARGGGMVFLHYAVNGRAAPEALAERIGLAWRDGPSKFRHGPVDLKISEKARHPITAGMTRVHFVDESYWKLVGDPVRVQVLATSEEDGKDQPMVWARETGRGRAVGCILGHYSWTFDDPLFRILVLRSIAWSAGENVSRLQELATVGARVEP
jgi:hypothetical protein